MDARAVAAFQARLDSQAARTAGHRHRVWARARLQEARSILDVGCGSGAVTADLSAWSKAEVVGVDVDVRMARRASQRGVLAGAADGARLPFRDDSFDAAVCHLTLLWAADPIQVLREMARVVRPGGLVLAAMEPDYGGTVHNPENPLVDLVWRGGAIRRRGGDPHVGRRLRGYFVAAGLRPDVGVGNPEVLTPEQDLDQWRRERLRYRRELAQEGFSDAQVDAWEQEYVQAISDGTQLTWFPLFWAQARRPVPGDVDRP